MYPMAREIMIQSSCILLYTVIPHQEIKWAMRKEPECYSRALVNISIFSDLPVNSFSYPLFFSYTALATNCTACK